MRSCRFVLSLVGVVLILAVGSGFVFASGPVGGDAASPAADWIVDIVDATREVGYNVSVAVDPETGHTYISYYEGINGDLWLARTGAPVGNCGPNNTWECQVVDINGTVGKYSSVVIGGPGPVAKIYISYHDVTNGSLRVFEGTVDRGTGVLVGYDYIVDQGDPGSAILAGKNTSVVVDAFGYPHIGYQTEIGGARSVRHATPVVTGSGNCGPLNGWECTTIDHGFEIGGFIDIEVDFAGNLFVAYLDAFSQDTHPVIATPVAFGGSCPNSDQWDCISVEHPGHDTGEYLSVGAGFSGEVHLAYRNATTESLEWASYVGLGQGNCGPGNFSFQCERIEGIGPGTSPAGIDIEVDDEGNPVIVYQDASSGDLDLKIARPLEATPWGPAGNCGPLSPTFFPTWLCETLDAGDINHAEAVGGVSIAMNANGEAAVAYRELFGIPPDEGRLKVAMEPWLVFRDGFESGDTTAWSSGTP